MDTEAWNASSRWFSNCREPWKDCEQWRAGQLCVRKIPWAQMQDDRGKEGEAGDMEARRRLLSSPRLLTPAQSFLSEPGSSPQTGEGHLFIKSSESFLPSHPSFQICFLLGLQTLSSYLPPLSWTSECLLWFPPFSPAVSRGYSAKSFLPANRPDASGSDGLLSTLSKRDWSTLGLGRQTVSSNDSPSKPQMHFVSI